MEDHHRRFGETTNLGVREEGEVVSTDMVERSHGFGDCPPALRSAPSRRCSGHPPATPLLLPTATGSNSHRRSAGVMSFAAATIPTPTLERLAKVRGEAMRVTLEDE